MSSPNNVQNAEYILKTLLFDPDIANQLGVYEWASETNRWKELVSILSAQICNRSQDDMVELTQYLADLGLLEIQDLAAIRIDGNEVDRGNELAAKISGAFQRKGMAEEDALNVLLPLCQIAARLKADFKGKIQLYLRHFGERMLQETLSLFELTGMKEDEVGLVFTAWLQNIMNVPVLLQAPEVMEFCQKHEIEVSELLEAVDNIDMNAAIVDELLRLAAQS